MANQFKASSSVEATVNALTLSNTPGAIKFGFWYSKAQQQYPTVHEGQYNNVWVVSRLRFYESDALVIQYRGFSSCRVCGCCNGTKSYVKIVDGVVYEWPEGLAHYLEVHCIKPPAELLRMLSTSDIHVEPTVGK